MLQKDKEIKKWIKQAWKTVDVMKHRLKNRDIY